MKNIKRILSLLLSLFLVMTLIPMGSVSVSAEEASYVAQIGEAKYETFDEAVAAAQTGDTIVLLDDITFGTDRSVPVWGNAGEQPFNIDLNGHTFKTDSEVSIDAGNNGYKASAFCFAYDNEANITVSGGEIKTAFGAGVYISGENVSLTLEDVDIAQNYPQNVQTTNEYSSAVRITYEASVEINGGTYGGKNSLAVSNSGGTAVINDGTFYNDIFFSNYTSKSYYDNTRNAVKSITINGGTFYGEFVNPDKGTLVITGGSFASDPTAYVPEEGYRVTQENDMYVVSAINYVAQIGETQYESLQEAINAAPNNVEAVVEVLVDIVETGRLTIPASKNIVLDLKGHEVSYSENASSKTVYFITNNGTLTVQDTSANADGSLVFTATPGSQSWSYETVVVYNQGTFTLASGTILNNSSLGLAYAVNNSSNSWDQYIVATFNMTGGAISAPNGDAALRIYQNCAASTNQNYTCENYVNISGGTIVDNGIFYDSNLYTTGWNLTNYEGANINTVVNITGGTINGLIDLKVRHPFNTSFNFSDGTFTNAKLRVRKVDWNSNIAEPSNYLVNITGGKWGFTSDANSAFNTSSAWTTTSSWSNYKPYYVEDGVFSVNLNEYEGIVLPEGKIGVENADEQTKVAYPYTVGVARTYVAQIGEAKYESLQEAINAVPNNTQTTIKMIADEVIEGNAGVSVPSTKNIVLDLNGQTIKNLVNENKGSQVITNSGTLTITDSSANGDGEIRNDVAPGTVAGNWYSTPQANYVTNVITNYGTLVVEGGTLYQTSNGYIAFAVDNISNANLHTPTATINGGTLKSEMTTVRLFCNSTTNLNSVSMAGGRVESKRHAFYLQNSNSKANKGSLEITDGTVSSTLNYLQVDAGANPSELSASISGGKFVGALSVDGTFEGFISGGKYAVAPGSSYIAEGYEAASNTDEDSQTYPYIVVLAQEYEAQVGAVKFATLQEAFDAVGENGTVVLLKDVELANTVEVETSAVLDLNGKTITSSKTAILVSSADVTVTGDGSIEVFGTGNYLSAIKADGEGTLTIESGSFSAAKDQSDYANGWVYAVYATGGADLVINGGSIEVPSTSGAMYNYAVYVDGAGDLTVNGGSILADGTGGNYAIQRGGSGDVTVTGGSITANTAFAKTSKWSSWLSPFTPYAVNNTGSGTVYVTGGYFKAEGDDDWAVYGNLIEGKASVTGGYYSCLGTTYFLNSSKLAENYKFVANDDATYNKTVKYDYPAYVGAEGFVSFEAAVEYVLENGGTITLKRGDASVNTYELVETDSVVAVIKEGSADCLVTANIEGYKLVALVDGDVTTYKLGPITIESNTEQSIEGSSVPSQVVYTVNTVVKESEDNNAEVIESTTNLQITVTANNVETVNQGGASVAKASLSNIKDNETLQGIVETAIEKAGAHIDSETASAEIEITVVKGAGDTQTEKKVVYEVHPEAIVKVNNEVVGNVELDNSQLKGTFKFKLYAGDIAEDGTYVKVTHIHSNDESEVMGSFLVTDGYIEITGVTSFSEFELEAVELEDVPHAAFGFNISLEESINIVYSVKNLIGDLEDFEIVYTDPTTGQEVSVQPTSRSVNKYTIAKCAARQMADEFSVKVYYQGSQINQTDTLSIKDYCEIIINGNYNNYLKDLCKATLDYGKYAQIEFAYNLENLANGGTDYFVNEEIDVPAYDGEILNRFSDLGVSFSLVTKSQTIFHVYFTSYNEEAYGFIVNGQVASEKNLRMIAPYKYDVTINNIKARDLGEKVEIVLDLAGEQDQMTVRLSPVDYMGYAVATDSQVEINRAYYNYYVKAYDYFNNK